MRRVVLLLYQGIRDIWNLTVTVDYPDRPGHTARRAKRQGRGRRHLGEVVGIDARLHHRTRPGLVSFQVPVGFVIGLPNPTKIRPAIDPVDLRNLAGRSRHR